MKRYLKPNLAFDFYATKHIQQGDELFLDYGDEWEEAWYSFLDSWTPLEDEADYLPASKMNKLLETQDIRTEVEQSDEPYPDNVLVRCHTILKRDNWDDYILEWQQNEYGFECFILERYYVEEIDATLYQVQINYRTKIGRPRALIRENVPREAIQFIDKPYTSDILLQGAFRHPLGISQSIFPEKWADLQSEHSPSHSQQRTFSIGVTSDTNEEL
jgi:hypothetical protein